MNKKNKSNIRFWVVLAILLLAYNAIVFLVPFAKTAVFWVSYAFTMVSFAVAAMSLVIAFRRPDARSRFYGFPIARIGVIYLLVQLVAGIVFMAVGKWVPLWLPTLLFVLALAAALVGLIGADMVVDEIHAQDEKLKKDVSTMRMLQSKVGQLSAQCENPDASRAVKSFAEELRFSDPVSGKESEEAEADLSALIDDLQQAVANSDAAGIISLCHRASGILAERNRLCKLGK